jgi:putative transposase
MMVHVNAPRSFFCSGNLRARRRAGRFQQRSSFRNQRGDWWVHFVLLMPDHLHFIWTLPGGDTDYGKRIGVIKAHFSKAAKPWFHDESLMNPSRRDRRETTIWQRRFWEHTIRDEEDLARHFDYIHYNPVKHGLVKCVADWPYSTFHRLVAEGIYPRNWAGGDEAELEYDD